MKLTLRHLLGLTALVLTIGCSREPEAVTLVVLKTLDNPFFKEIERGLNDTWAQGPFDSTLHVRAGAKEGDISGQRQVIEGYLERYVDGLSEPRIHGLILTPAASGPELVDLLRRLNNSGVPIIIVDTRIEESALSRGSAHYEAFVGSSNKEGGMLAASLLFANAPHAKRLLLLNGEDGHETAAARREGFLEGIAVQEKESAIQRDVIERTANWRRSEARSVIDAFISMGQSFDGVFAANDEMALGVIEAFRQAGRGDVPPIIGFDATPEARLAVKEGLLAATVAQDPYGMGREAALTLSRLRQGLPVDKDRLLPTQAIVRQ